MTNPKAQRLTKNSNKEWRDVECLVCMEHPHDAVALICTSHNNGCRPYLCNSMQFNCLTKYHVEWKTRELSCPLCRGQITNELKVDEKACQFMNSRKRACNQESCEFSGTCEDLKKHWLASHVTAQERDRLEQIQELLAMKTRIELRAQRRGRPMMSACLNYVMRKLAELGEF